MSEDYGQFPERWWRVLDAVEQVAEETGATLAQVAIQWVKHVPGLTSVPIIGATSVDQLQETLKAVDLTLSDDHYEQITKAGELTELSTHTYTYT